MTVQYYPIVPKDQMANPTVSARKATNTRGLFPDVLMSFPKTDAPWIFMADDAMMDE